jgi:D-alanine-D-alanine ligase
MRIVVLLGGVSPEREVSLRSGGGVARALLRLGHRVDLLDTATGRRIRTPEEAIALGSRAPRRGHAGSRGHSGISRADERWKGALLRSRSRIGAVFVALHGGDGEDGTIQGWLERAGFPFTGSGSLASGMAMDKAWAKRLFRLLDIPTPDWIEARLPKGAGRAALLESLDEAAIASVGGFPVVTKPNAVGSSVGISIVREGGALRRALLLAARYDERVLIEQFIPGRELTVTVLGGRAFPVVEVIPSGDFYDYKRKYTSGASRYEAPAAIPDGMARLLQDYSERAFREFRCRGAVRIDFRVRGDGAAFCLELNTVPGLTELSLVPMAARAAGMSYEALIREMVEAARAWARPSPAARPSAHVATRIAG